MTSKEALEILGDIPLGNNYYNHFSNYELKKVYSIEYEAIKKDLEVLEILKKHLRVERDNIGDSDDFEETLSFTKGIKYQDYAFCNFSMKPEGELVAINTNLCSAISSEVLIRTHLETQ